MEIQSKKGRVWFITGASSGFGRNLAEAALAQGDYVVATARNTTKIEDLAERYGAAALPTRLDVTDPGSVRKAIGKAVEVFGRIDVVVNNAGYGLFGTVEEVTDQQIRDVFNTNVFGLLDVTRSVLPVLRAQGFGHIVNIASNGGRFSVPGLGIYHGTKFAVEGICESLAQELAPLGIKLTIVEPGGFDTDYETRSLVAALPMAEYDFVRKFIEKFAADYLRSDPAAAARAILQMVELEKPPLRLALGINVTQQLIDKLAGDIEDYKRFDYIWQDAEPNPNQAKWGWRETGPQGHGERPVA